MSKNHYPGANRTAQYWGGKFVGSTMNTNCVCLHTTETSVWPGYGGGSAAPHMTILPNIKARTVSIRQHFPAGKSSRALVNLAGGVQTNTLNVFQIELIGTCDNRYRESRKEWGKAGVDYIYWPDAPDWLLEAIAPVFGWLDAEWPDFKIVDATPRGWVRYPDSYGLRARQRMTAREWAGAFGIFGHQHVPENTHGDPGNFPIDRLIAAATGRSGTTPPPVPPTPSAPKPQTAVWDLPSTWAIGSTGDAVTTLGQRLVAHGFATHHDGDGYQPGPVFTTYDRDNVADFQEDQGWAGDDADGYPGPETFRRLAATPTTPAKPLPVKPGEGGPVVEYISVNLAGYNDPVGIATAVRRAKEDIPEYLRPKRPLWFHFQECSKLMLEHIDAAFPEYKRVAAGGKGRESYYLRDAGVEILGAELLNVTHMLRKDTKEHLVIVWEIDGYRAVDVNFHNENEGSTFQVLQLRDVMTNARRAADRHAAPRANIAVTGDANLKTAAAFAWSQRWAEAKHIAKKKIDLGISTMNRWSPRLTTGSRIDVDIFQRDADVLEAEVLFGSVIADHWPHRVVRRLKKK